MQRIIVSVTNDLNNDQRVYRICMTLVEMGYELLLIGRRLPTSLPLERKYETQRMRLFFNKGFLFYAEYNLRLFFKLLFIKKDILLANDLDTLLPNFLVSRLLKKPLVFDSHELFSEIPELNNRPRVKWFWKSLEKGIIPKLKNCYTVSESIASYYKNQLGINFNIVRNFPLMATAHDEAFSLPFNSEGRKLIIYQGAVNMGRGLELMIETMPLIDNAIFMIVGDGDILETLKSKVKQMNLNDKVKFLGKVSPKNLKRVTPLADLGISLEEDMGLNYRFTLPNKLFDYIQAKIPVIVSNLAEMRKVVENFNVGTVLKERTTENLASVIHEVLEKDKNSWNVQLQKAADKFVWDKESARIKEIFNHLD